MENNFTIRIHLDKTTKDNGALKVINNSHSKGIFRIENLEIENETNICEVEKGGIMIMKPLLFHASNKTTNNERRRVIHIEFSKQELPDGLEWSEKMILNKLKYLLKMSALARMESGNPFYTLLLRSKKSSAKQPRI